MAKRRKKPVTSVFIRSKGRTFTVTDAHDKEVAVLTHKELMDRAKRENWHLIPAAVVHAVNDFVSGGWKLTRPPHCRKEPTP